MYNMKLDITVPDWFSKYVRNPNMSLRRVMQKIDARLARIQHNSAVYCEKVLHDAGVRERTRGGLYDVIRRSRALGHGIGTVNISSGRGGGVQGGFSGSYTIHRGVGETEALSRLKTEDGLFEYWDILDRGYEGYWQIAGLKKLTYPVNAHVLAGKRDSSARGGRAYITKFRKYWGSSKGSWGKPLSPADRKLWPGYEGYGVFESTFHPNKSGIHFIKKTHAYMADKVERHLGTIARKDFEDGFQMKLMGRVHL